MYLYPVDTACLDQLAEQFSADSVSGNRGRVGHKRSQS